MGINTYRLARLTTLDYWGIVKELRRIQKESAKQTIAEMTAKAPREINDTADRSAEIKIAYSEIARDPTIVERYDGSNDGSRL